MSFRTNKPVLLRNQLRRERHKLRIERVAGLDLFVQHALILAERLKLRSALIAANDHCASLEALVERLQAVPDDPNETVSL